MEFCERVVYGKKRDSYFSKLGNKRRGTSETLCIYMYGDRLRYHLLVAVITMLLLLMRQLEKHEFIALKKSVMFLTFKKWKDLVKNTIGKKLKCLRSDNGDEY